MGCSSGRVGSLRTQFMLHHGLVGSQRSQSYCLKSSGLVGLSSRVEDKGYGSKVKFWMDW